MPVRVYVMLTWTTEQRLPLIHAGVAELLGRLLPAIARRYGARVIATGMVQDHVHLVLQLSPVIDIPRLVQGLKGSSARVVNREGLMPRARLHWAAGYDLRSIGVRDLRRAVSYVRNQAARHPDRVISG